MNLTHLFIGILFIVVGIATFILRNTPNPYIGVRLGYTYLSKEAWKKSNTFAAIYCILFGILLTFIDYMVKISDSVFVAIMLIGIAPMVLITYKIAKETYEREDLKEPVDGEIKPIEVVNIKNYLLVQLTMIGIYILFASLLWDKLPDTIAIHFDVYGNPDRFADKFSGVIFIPILGMIVIPIITALIHKEPMLVRFPVYGKGQKLLMLFLTVLQAFIFAVMLLVLLYNAEMINFGEWFTMFVFGFVAFLIAWIYWIWKHYKT